jgi:hypothetical protein
MQNTVSYLGRFALEHPGCKGLPSDQTYENPQVDKQTREHRQDYHVDDVYTQYAVTLIDNRIPNISDLLYAFINL